MKKSKAQSLGRDEVGATAIEYGLIVAFIALAILGVLGSLGEENAKTLKIVHNGFNNT